MSSSPRLSPLQAVSSSLVGVATGLRTSPNGLTDVLEIRPIGVCHNAVTMLRTASPLLERLLTTLGPFAILGFGIYKFAWQGLGLPAVIDKISGYFTSTVTIPGNHAAHRNVLKWMAEHDVGLNKRSRMLNTSRTNMLEFIPSIGLTSFRWQGHAMSILRDPDFELRGRDNDSWDDAPRGRCKGDLVVSCFAFTGGDAIIEAFIKHVHDTNEQPLEDIVPTTTIYRVSRDATWDEGIVRPSRNLDSVTMEAEKKDSLVRDIGNYLSYKSKTWYANRGIPWRRGYLLYGPPGTGKTSLCTAIAGHFHLSIFIISLSNPLLDDLLLEELFNDLPDRALVLLEDVDSAGIKRERMCTTTTVMKDGKEKKSVRYFLTLSGLLNVIDGPCSKEGRVLILTSNTPDTLDPALVRPGRVDRMIPFGNASSEVAEKLFAHILGGDEEDGDDCEANETETESISDSLPSPSQSREQQHLDIPALARTFASRIPADKLTPAEVQNFLLVHREDPALAVDKAAAWAEELILTKRQGKNVAGFDWQVEGVEGKGQKEDKRDASPASRIQDTAGWGEIVEDGDGHEGMPLSRRRRRMRRKRRQQSWCPGWGNQDGWMYGCEKGR